MRKTSNSQLLPWCKNIHLLCGLCLLVFVNCASTTSAYQLQGRKWQQPSTTFYVDIPGADGLWNTAFEGAMFDWSVGTVFHYDIVRGTYSDPCDTNDHRNGVGFDSNSCGDGWDNTTLAITISWYDLHNTLIETDIVFNSNEPWDVYSTPWQSSADDFRRVAVHELGHALGLGHEDTEGVVTIMGTYAGDVTVPQQDDIAGVAAIYGAAPVASSPSTITVPDSDDDGSYTISWSASATNGVTYVLQESTSSTFAAAGQVYSGTELYADINGRSTGTTYYYQVKATKSGYTDSGWTIGTNGCMVSFPSTAAQNEFSISGNSAGNNYYLFLTAQIDVAPSDIGHAGMIYVAAQLPSSLGGGWYFLEGTDWVEWTGGDFPVHSTGTLANTDVPVLSGLDVSSLAGTNVIVGYGRSESDLLANQKYAVIYTIPYN